MREIKFRAWDATDKRMLPSAYGNIGIFEQLEGATYDGEITVMQYTGLKDKNGVEIYEGDIATWYGIKAQVHWADGHAGFMHGSDSIYKRYAEQCEVIGNIYENPGLLS